VRRRVHDGNQGAGSNVLVPSRFSAGVLVVREEGFEDDSQFKYKIVLVYVSAENLKKEPSTRLPFM
jgi:hypothetical protein